ncbi:N-formylglutamate amidohydrolase [Sagittula stellata]|uniref:N-formylglutamate amidohydrolase n=1 Tax=Sagittula stellata (strain ATCC 700073 / DSM 11524 / E-37) TaxID=388399 RepID=A3K0B4_SAGS3|nr:N-formylglutamate amidohydrolase [Sagittula stellata]EBA09229.1 hypothetical protein SSE37_23344 [Sagittula stellata E-37]
MSEGPGGDRLNAVDVMNETGRGGVLLICEHASAEIPARFGDLGLTAEARVSHAAWDPGARDLAVVLSAALDAPMVAGAVSRLVYDCNRPPEAPGAMPARSEVFDVPGNAGLTEMQKAERVEMVYRPFHAAVAARLDEARAVVTVHSFTPVFHGAKRDTEIGLLHDSDARLVDLMLPHAPKGRVVHRNRPYGPEDGVTHTLKTHALYRGLPNVMIEVRNDLLTTPEDIRTVARDLMSMLTPALEATCPAS